MEPEGPTYAGAGLCKGLDSLDTAARVLPAQHGLLTLGAGVVHRLLALGAGAGHLQALDWTHFSLLKQVNFTKITILIEINPPSQQNFYFPLP
jgi:hypothetical protein